MKKKLIVSILIILFPKHRFMGWYFFHFVFVSLKFVSANTETRKRKCQTLVPRVFKYCRRSFIVFLNVSQEASFKDLYLSNLSIWTLYRIPWNHKMIILVLKILTTRIFLVACIILQVNIFSRSNPFLEIFLEQRHIQGTAKHVW